MIWLTWRQVRTPALVAAAALVVALAVLALTGPTLAHDYAELGLPNCMTGREADVGTLTCGDLDGARALLDRLASVELGALDATGGTVPANVEAFATVAPDDEIDERRLAITRETIATGMITYPPLERFPAVEDAGWQAINEALRGDADPDDVPARVQAAAISALA